MPAVTTVRWDPSGLNGALASAFKASVALAVTDAKAHTPSERMAGATGRVTSPTTAYLKPTGLGHVFEKGRRGGYLIRPRGVSGGSQRGRRSGFRVSAKRGGAQALKFRDGGGYAFEVTGGNMAPKPYVGPAGVRWAKGGYQTVARVALIEKGFR